MVALRVNIDEASLRTTIYFMGRKMIPWECEVFNKKKIKCVLSTVGQIPKGNVFWRNNIYLLFLT